MGGLGSKHQLGKSSGLKCFDYWQFLAELWPGKYNSNLYDTNFLLGENSCQILKKKKILQYSHFFLKILEFTKFLKTKK